VAYARDIKAGRASIELTTQDRMQRGLARARARLQAFGRDVQAMGTTMLGAATGLLAPMAAALKTFSDIGDGAAKMARRTGLSGEAVQSLGFAAKRSGTDLESLEKGVRRMGRTIWDAERGLSTATDALGDLGLTVGDLAGKRPEEQFKVLAEALSRVDDASRRSAIAQQIFGRSGTMLLPMFEQGRKGIEALQKKFEALGVTLSSKDLAAAERFTDALGDLWTAVKYGVALLGSALEPAVRDLVGAGQDWLKEAAAWVKNNRDLIVQYGRLALRIGKWLAIVGGGLVVVGKLATSLSALVGVTKTLHVAFAGLSAHPFAAIAAGVGGLIVALDTAIKYTANLSRQQQNVLANADRERAADLAKLERLQEIQADHERTNAEIAEAKRLVDDLEGKYGDLGLSVNEATGEISGLAGAMEKLTTAMRKIVGIQLETALMEARRNLHELVKEREAEGERPITALKTFYRAITGDAEAVDEKIQRMLDREKEAAAVVFDLQQRLASYRAGEKGALTGGAEPGTAGLAGGAEPVTAGLAGGAAGDADAASRQADLERDLLHRLVREKLKGIDDEHTRRMAMIRQQYREDRERLEAQGASAEAIHRRNLLLDEQLANERKRYQQEVFDAAGREAEAWFAKQEAQARDEQALRDQIRRAEIEAMDEGIEKRRAQIELEREIALGRAAETGADADLVNKLYDVMLQGIEAGDRVRSVVSTRGTFSARAANLAVGSVAERTAKATEEAAKRLKNIEREMRQGAGLAVTQ